MERGHNLDNSERRQKASEWYIMLIQLSKWQIIILTAPKLTWRLLEVKWKLLFNPHWCEDSGTVRVRVVVVWLLTIMQIRELVYSLTPRIILNDWLTIRWSFGRSPRPSNYLPYIYYLGRVNGTRLMWRFVSKLGAASGRVFVGRRPTFSSFPQLIQWFSELAFFNQLT